MGNEKGPFDYRSEAAEFVSSFTRTVSQLVNDERNKFISAENIQRYSHGVGMQSHNSSYPDEITNLKKFSHEMTLLSEDVIKHRCELLKTMAHQLASEMSSAFIGELFSTVSESCDRVGNVVSALDKSPAEAFYEMIQKVEFAVGRDGLPRLPTIYTAPGGLEKFKMDKLFVDIAFKEKLNNLLESKKITALNAESARLARFMPRDEQ